MSELRKKAFGEDNEDAKALLWGREQAWYVMSKLASRLEVWPTASPILACC